MMALSITAISFATCALAESNEGPDMADMMMQKKDQPYAQARQKMSQMSPQQRQAYMEEIKSKWNGMSDSDKQAFRDKVKMHAQKIKERMERRCKEMQDNNGEMIFIRLYGLEQMKQ